MKTKIFALFTSALLVLNLTAFAADVKSEKARKLQTGQLVALLPQSDAVAVFDSKRFFGEALPAILSANQPMLAHITSKLEEMQSKTGIDLRQFEQVAVGVTMKQIGPREFDFDPVAIARGEFSAGALVAVAKLASNGTYREEKIGSSTVYVFSAKDLAHKNAPKAGNSKVAGAIERTINGLTNEVAVTSIDKNTLAIGSLARVRQTLQSKGRTDAEISNLILRKPNALLSFAAKTPNGLAKFLPVDNDELGRNVESIRYIFGSLDVAGGNAVLQTTARTVRPEQAQGLLDTLEGLQVVGKAFLGGSSGADKQVYARMIDNAKFSRAGSEVTLDLLVPQGDIDILVGEKK